jgi:hypothetical protein
MDQSTSYAVERATYRDLIRRYSDGVASGHFDLDITSKRVRRYVSILLNLASNDGMASVIYPPSDDTRERVCRAMGNVLWDARALLTAAESTDVDAAAERASQILRGI